MITLIYLYLLGVIIYPFTMLIKRLNYILLKKTIRIIVFGIGIIIGFKFDYSYLIIEIRETRCMVIILAFLIGIACAYLSIVMVNNFQIININIHTKNIGLIKNISIISIIFMIFACIYEEIIWRGTIQNYFVNKFENLSVIFILAFLFMLSHFKNRFRYVELLDIGIFSLIISWLYYFSGNLLFVIVIHFSRNLAIELFDLLKE